MRQRAADRCNPGATEIATTANVVERGADRGERYREQRYRFQSPTSLVRGGELTSSFERAA